METQTFEEVVDRRMPLIDVTSDLARLQIMFVNAYLYGEPGGGDRSWVLIDAGLPFSASRIMRAAAKRYGENVRPSAIILTHGHFDHVGAAKELAQAWDVPIFAHHMETPYLTGRSSYPPPDPVVGGGAMALLSPLYPRGPVDLRGHLRELPYDHTVPGMDGWRWIPTPGHTAGHVSLFRDQDRLLIAGDAFVTTKQESLLSVVMQRPRVSRPPAYYTTDWRAAKYSVEKLALLGPSIAATGHGPSMAGEEMRRQLRTLANDFDVFMPRHGRYVKEPAIMDERGVVRIPPRAVDARTLTLVGVGARCGAISSGKKARRAAREPGAPHVHAGLCVRNPSPV